MIKAVDKPTFKIVTDGPFIVMAQKLPIITEKLPNGREMARDLKGLGNTGTGASGNPWLITLTNTRTSYICLNKENIAPSYICERLHYYETDGRAKLTNLVHKLLQELI